MTLPDLNLANPDKLKEILSQAEQELSEIQPRIDELEAMQTELRELKLAKQRLLTLKMSLSALIDNVTLDKVQANPSSDHESYLNEETNAQPVEFSELSTSKTFDPEKAFQDVDQVLKQKNSLNYQMFKAVVFKGGKASTEEIKDYLVQIEAKQPQTGESFQDAPLSDISSRANYLVRKGVLRSADRGLFFTPLGWVEPDSVLS